MPLIWMIKYMVIVVSLFLLFVFYIFCLKGRNGKKLLNDLSKYNFAHRGLHNEARAENSISAFLAAKEKGYGVELDVHILSDNTLAVFHDKTLDRVTGKSGKIGDLKMEDLKNYNLLNSADTIPTFEEVLEIFDHKVPLIVELKNDEGRCNDLCEKVCKVLDNYKGIYCIESFDPRCLMWLRKNRPDIIRGQLVQNFLKSPSGMGKVLDLVLTSLILNIATRPDFIATKFADRKDFSIIISTKFWNTKKVFWTIDDMDDQQKTKKENAISIFEKIIP